MKFERQIEELIRARHSIRTYTGGPIDPDLMKKLLEACSSQDRGVFGEPARFTVVEKPFRKDQPVSLGDYGLQKNPRYFFVGAIRKGDRSRESWGYLLEHLVLKATELGLGTCWMGYFNREFFSDFRTEEDELMPTVAVVGVPPEKPRFGERMIRFGIRANSRRDWKALFHLCKFGLPLTREGAGPYANALEMLRWAPSSGNSQPWRVVKDENAHIYHFFLKKVKQNYYAAGMHNVDIGIAMSHFYLAARENGLDGAWRLDDPRLPSLPPGTEYRLSWAGK
jgi:nitroreductase